MQFREYLIFFNDTATTEIYTLSLHDALPISATPLNPPSQEVPRLPGTKACGEPGSHCVLKEKLNPNASGKRSEEHTSELQSRQYLVCRLLLEKKNDTCRTTGRVDRRANAN